MAMMKFIALLLLALIAVSMIESTQVLAVTRGKYYYGPGSVKPYQCKDRCRVRCKLTSHKNPCWFFCEKCCRTCLCVPPGYYGHKEVCPCYNNWKTQQGGPKCP